MALGVGIASFAACTRVELADQPPPVAIEGGFAGEPQGGAGSQPGEGGSGMGGVGFDLGGAPVSVEVGIWPTFAARSADDQVAPVVAAVQALSAGSLTLPLYTRWDDLSGATGSPRAVTWARLEAMIAPYRARGADVALCVGVVDRQRPAWPVATLDEGAEAAIERTIDEVFSRYGPLLSHLCFGHELDRYLAVAEPEEGDQVVELVRHAVEYARRHPSKAARTSISTSITLSALESETEVLLARLLIGDQAVVSYDALDAEGELKEPEAISGELGSALEVLARLSARPKVLALFEVGYPSGGASGATERAQRTFYEALFDTLDAHRSELSFVGVYGLGDRSSPDCEAEAGSFGEGRAASARPLVRCKMGLRAERGEKLAWPVVSRALSRDW